MGRLNRQKVVKMKRLKELLSLWLDGRSIKGCKMPPPAFVYQLIDIYNCDQKEFISSDVKRVLDYCKIPYKEKGIGWKVVKI